MAISYGLTNPAAFINSVETYPDLFKFYTAVPTRSTESSAANQRRPVLYTSLNGGIGWKYESQSSGFYYVNYGGNFYANEYVPINSNTSYVVYGKNKTTKLLSYYISIAWYDSSKNFISRSDTTSDYNVGIFTSPSNAVYARIRCNLDGTTVTQAMVDSYKWYFAKESDFKVMNKYGDIVCN